MTTLRLEPGVQWSKFILIQACPVHLMPRFKSKQVSQSIAGIIWPWFMDRK